MTFLDLIAEGWRYPRKVMAGYESKKGQIIVESEDEVIRHIEEADYVDCFIQSNSDWERSRGILDVLFIDIDNLQDLDSAKKQAFRAASRIETVFYVKPHIQFSGYKGYHVLTPVNPNPLPGGSRELKAYLAYLQDYLSKGACDRQILGDAVRLFRIPETYNSKGIRAYGDGYVEVLQEWDEKRADPRILYGSFKIYEADKRIKAGKTGRYTPRDQPVIRGVRREIYLLIERAGRGDRLEHMERLAVACELINLGWQDEDIIQVFSKQEDFDPNKTAYFISHARSRMYKPFSRDHLKELIEP